MTMLLTRERFWSIVEEFRSKEFAPREVEFKAFLRTLPIGELVWFNYWFERVKHDSRSEELFDYVHGAFDYAGDVYITFREWLICQGCETYTSVVENLDRLDDIFSQLEHLFDENGEPDLNDTFIEACVVQVFSDRVEKEFVPKEDSPPTVFDAGFADL